MSNTNRDIKALTERYLKGEISRAEFELMLEEFSSESQAVEEVLQDHFEQVMDAYHPAQTTPQHRLAPWMAVAASLLLLLGIGAGVLFFGAQPSSELVSHQTAYGEQSDYILEDSSHVYLNAGSTLAYEPFKPEKGRVVTFQGEGFFDIFRDVSRPFTIHSGEMDIQVLGTAFNVEAYPEEDFYRVTVTEGKVAVSSHSIPNLSETLTKGQSIVIQKDSGSYRVEAAAEILWKARILAFDKTPFDQVIRKMERWYGVELEVVDSSLYKLTLNGRFADKDVHEMIRAIAFLANKEHTQNPELIKINPLPMKHQTNR
ncbi:FecR domain-containing protein [Echinicola vietnamensis]|uniref:Fe2+-dicitrate sensor, membrane component n=1 Tax=Echinicola vietnamensis (strain DSM 17526 / LMG 23754 / KMM 6221) TaxID=926556 RepID=L0G287_ECHVK|nr:FecR domain-containing protein [Echinicola vietnamensis]AGA79642.1 Fe2+-dicitrate sensor, membrane component [Echinicola vietnamensis DSM 17526]